MVFDTLYFLSVNIVQRMHKWINFFCLLFNLRPLKLWLCYHQFNSVTQSCPTLSNLMNRSTPGLPVHHQLLEFTQTHVHRVGDAIQPSHPLSSPSPPAPNPSQHQSLFQWVSSSHEVAQSIGVSALASVLPMNTQDWSPLEWTGCSALKYSFFPIVNTWFILQLNLGNT